MTPLLRPLREGIALRRLRRRFPRAELYSGVAVSADSRLDDYVVLFPGVAIESSVIGRFTYVQARSQVINAEVGPFCSVASDVTIGMAEHPTNMVSTSPVFYDPSQPLPRFLTDARRDGGDALKTVIGADVWIGQGAMIKSGVRVGVGAVIGAGAMVTRDVPPYEITAGVPSRRIRLRFSDPVVAELLASKWWELDEASLRSVAADFTDPAGFLAALRARGVPR